MSKYLQFYETRYEYMAIMILPPLTLKSAIELKTCKPAAGIHTVRLADQTQMQIQDASPDKMSIWNARACLLSS